MTPQDLSFLMHAALAQAEIAAQLGEVPVGAVVSYRNQIIAQAHNLVETKHSATRHAEILALEQASAQLGDWRLNEAILVVTLEPCTMCTGAIKLHRVGTIVFGAYDQRMGALHSLFDLAQDFRLGPVPRVFAGVEQERCVELLQGFFGSKR